MVRVLFVGLLGLAGLGAAATTLSPSLLTGPTGEPLVMASAQEAILQPASFDGTACPSALLFSSAGDGTKAGLAGAHIVAFALRTGERGVAVGIEDFANGARRASKTIVLIFDDAGRLVAAGDPQSLHLGAGTKLAASCLEAENTDPGAPI